MAELQTRVGELEALGYGLCAVSVDLPDVSRDLAQRLGLTFPLLSDSGREVIERYGVFNREEKGGIAYPATFVLDRERIVLLRSLDRMRTRIDPSALFAFLRSGAATTEAPAQARVRPGPRELWRVLRGALRWGIRTPRA
ncbi:MAG: hypothetical protein NVSMB47_02070 [Polyangiales bacterium]